MKPYWVLPLLINVLPQDDTTTILLLSVPGEPVETMTVVHPEGSAQPYVIYPSPEQGDSDDDSDN